MFCKKCHKDISPDCMLTNGICVFCHYKTNEWESNGQIIKKRKAIINYKSLLKIYIQHYRRELNEIENVLKKIPKGTIIRKKIRGHYYYYLAYRNGPKVKYDYIGKNKPLNLVEEIRIRNNIKKKVLDIKRILFVLREAKRPATVFNRFNILERDNFTCQYCGRKAPDVVLEVDHVIPVCKGGTDASSNLKTACFQCNNQKRAKYEYRNT